MPPSSPSWTFQALRQGWSEWISGSLPNRCGKTDSISERCGRVCPTPNRQTDSPAVKVVDLPHCRWQPLVASPLPLQSSAHPPALRSEDNRREQTAALKLRYPKKGRYFVTPLALCSWTDLSQAVAHRCLNGDRQTGYSSGSFPLRSDRELWSHSPFSPANFPHPGRSRPSGQESRSWYLPASDMR